MIQWKHLPSKVILDVAELCDGHTIFKVEAFTDLGVPSELIEQYTQRRGHDRRTFGVIPVRTY